MEHPIWCCQQNLSDKVCWSIEWWLFVCNGPIPCLCAGQIAKCHFSIDSTFSQQLADIQQFNFSKTLKKNLYSLGKLYSVHFFPKYCLLCLCMRTLLRKIVLDICNRCEYESIKHHPESSCTYSVESSTGIYSNVPKILILPLKVLHTVIKAVLLNSMIIRKCPNRCKLPKKALTSKN